MTNANDPIDVVITSTKWNAAHKGLTKREYFSAMALQGVCATLSGSRNAERQSVEVGKTLSETMAIYAVDVADALIKALNETK